MLKQCIEKIDQYQDCLILTPNKRMARYIQRDLDLIAQQNNQTPWRSVSCIPLASWCKYLYRLCQLHPKVPPRYLLSAYESELLWQQLVKDDSHLEALIDQGQCVRLAIDAWRTCHLWRITPTRLQQRCHDTDQKTFVRWYHTMNRCYQTNDYIDASQIPAHITQHMDCLPPHRLPQHIIRFAFDDIAPAYQHLFETLGAHQVTISDSAYPSTSTQPLQYAATDADDEIRTMAHWAKTQIQATPNASIACVVPDLQSRQQQISACFTEVFHPEKLTETESTSTLTVNISGGQPLAQRPVIAQALTNLGLCLDTITPQQFSALLRSPFGVLGQAATTHGAYWDLTFRQTYHASQITLSDSLNWLKRTQATHPNLQHAVPVLEQLANTLTQAPGQQSHAAWAKLFGNCLTLLAWPGNIDIDSLQYQCLNQWQATLATLATLDTIAPQVSGVEALQRLNQLCKQTLFQPQTQDTPVQVLGLLEAAGLQFDNIWVMGLTHQTVPARANPNPFINLKLQHDLNCPHASAARETQFGAALIARFVNCASSTCIVSYAQTDQAAVQTPSPFIATYPLILREQLVPTMKSLSERQYGSITLDTLNDEHGPAITTPTPLPGGSQLLMHYNACPFRGFTYYRLRSQALPAFAPLISALTRGLYCHRAMEWFWQQVQSSHALARLTESARQALLMQAIDVAIAEQIPANTDAAQQHLLSVEKECIHAILSTWLLQEQSRKAFTVLHTETLSHIQYQHCRLTLRIDRIDKTDTGDIIIIDYKTGQSNINDWLSTRMASPQLPLYALTHDQPVDGLLVASLHTRQIQYNGITRNPQIETATPIEAIADYRDWSRLLAHWRCDIDNTITQIENGSAVIDPVQGKQTCAYCYCQSFCRIYEKERDHA